MSFRLIPLLAAGAFLATGGSALAQTATATSTVNVRSGPGGQYEVIDQLPAGETVRIIDCQGDWCEISMGGESGFVSRGYLDDGGRRSRARVYEERDDDAGYGGDEPDDTAGLVVGGYYESQPFYIREGYYYWGGRWYSRRPGVAGWRDRSWRRWGERDGPGATRDGRTNRPPRIDDRRVRIDRNDRGAGRPDGREERDDRLGGREGRGGGDFDRGERDQGERDRGDRGRDGRAGVDRAEGPGGGREAIGGGGRSGRGDAMDAGRGGGSDGGGRTPGSGGSSDRGDRIGLDRAGSGGGRGDR